MKTINKTITDQQNPFERYVRLMLAGNLVAIGTHPVADTNHPDITKYFKQMEVSPTRQFHSIEHIFNCLKYLQEVSSDVRDISYVIAALLFHKICYVPGDKGSLKRSCEYALEYYPQTITVKLIGLIKAAQVENPLSKIHDEDGDLVADIVNYPFGLPEDDFKKKWGLMFKEFSGAGYPPKKFKQFAVNRLRRLQDHAQTCGIYRTAYFANKSEVQAVENIQRMLDEILKVKN